MDNKTKILQKALDFYKGKDFLKFSEKEFRSWFVQWIQEVDCELNPDPWMDEERETIIWSLKNDKG